MITAGLLLAEKRDEHRDDPEEPSERKRVDQRYHDLLSWLSRLVRGTEGVGELLKHPHSRKLRGTAERTICPTGRAK